MNTTRNKKGLALLMLLGILIPYLTGMIPAIEVTAKTAPVTVMENIVDAEEVKADVSYEVSEYEIQWEISYEKKASSQINPRRLKVQIDVAGTGLGSVRNLNYDGEGESDGWYVLGNTYSSEVEEGVITFATDLVNYEVGQQKVHVTFQVDEKIIEEVVVPAELEMQLIDEVAIEVEVAPESLTVNETENFDILAEEVAGPHEIALDEATLNVVAPGEVEEAPVVEEVPVGEVEAPVAEGSEEENLVEEVQEETSGNVQGPMRAPRISGGDTVNTFIGPTATADPFAYSKDNDPLGKYPEHYYETPLNTLPKTTRSYNYGEVEDEAKVGQAVAKRPYVWRDQDQTFDNGFLDYTGAGLRKWAEPTDKADEFKINLEILGNAIYPKPMVDIVLVLDKSGSMGSGTGSRDEEMKKAVSGFINAILDADDPMDAKIGMVAFSGSLSTSTDNLDNVTTTEPFTTEATDLIESEAFTQKAESYTPIVAGLRAGTNLLYAGRDEAAKYLIFFGDGASTHYYAHDENDDGTVNTGIETIKNLEDNLKGNSSLYNNYRVLATDRYYRDYLDIAFNTSNTMYGTRETMIGTLGYVNYLKTIGPDSWTNQGVKVHSIAYQVGGTRFEAAMGKNTIQNIADNSGQYFETEDSAELIKTFANLAENITKTVQTAKVVDPLSEYVELVGNVSDITRDGIMLNNTSRVPWATDVAGRDNNPALTSKISFDKKTITVSDLNLGKNEVLKVSYTVRLKDEYHTGLYYPANGETYLINGIDNPKEKKIHFAVPSVRAFPKVSTIGILKTSDVEGNVAGAKFTLSKGNTAVATATSDTGGLGDFITNTGTYQLSPGEYTIIETESPAGHIPSIKIYSFVILPNGTLGSRANEISIDENGKVTLTVDNAFKKFPITVVKTSDVGASVDSASFKLFSGADGIGIADMESSWEFKYDGTLVELSPGTYTVKETSGLPGHILDETEYTFTIDGSGALTENTNFSLMDGVIVFTLVNNFDKLPISILKTSDVGMTAAGAKFSLWAGLSATGDILGTVVTTGKTDYFVDSNDNEVEILPGEYSIKETEALPGHTLDETVYTFTVSNEGLVTGDAELIDGSIHINNLNVAEELNLEVTKIDGTSGDKTLLDDVMFDLHKANGELWEVVFENELTVDGIISKSGLGVGSYRLTETATIAGYQLSEPNVWEFEVEAVDGEGLRIKSNSNGFSQVEGKFTITKEVKNFQKDISLELVKCDDVSDIPLEGAIFEISSEEDFTTILANGTSDSNGIVSFDKHEVNPVENFNVQPGETYYMRETVAPDGYILLPGVFKIIVGTEFEATISYDGDNEKEVEISKGADSNLNQIKIEVSNDALNPLPSTGGSGIYQFLLLGALVLTGTFGVVIFEKNRSRKGAY